jgi:hypothetical protein
MDTLKQSLVHEIRVLNLGCLSLDFSIMYSNGCQVRNLRALRKGVTTLQALVDALPEAHNTIPLEMRYKLYDCIFVISGYSHLFLEHYSTDLTDDARVYLTTTLSQMRSLTDVIEANGQHQLKMSSKRQIAVFPSIQNRSVRTR